MTFTTAFLLNDAKVARSLFFLAPPAVIHDVDGATFFFLLPLQCCCPAPAETNPTCSKNEWGGDEIVRLIKLMLHASGCRGA